MTAFDPDYFRPSADANFIAGEKARGRGRTFEVARPSDGAHLAPLHAADESQLADAQKTSSWGRMEPCG